MGGRLRHVSRLRTVFCLVIATLVSTALTLPGSMAVADNVQPAALTPGVYGEIRDWPSEAPIAGIVVRVVSDEEEDLQQTENTYTTITAADGSFTISGLPEEGWYHVSFIDPTDTYCDEHWWGQGVPIESAFALYLDSPLDLGVQYMMTPAEVNSHRVPRVSGDDRYQTAIKMADKFGSAETVVLASGEAFPDALAAAPLAGTYGAPILLTPSDALPDGLTECLTRLGTNTVIVVGGTNAVSNSINLELERLGYEMIRYAGKDRYDTARVLAIETALRTNASGERIPFLVRGDDFADALAIAPFAWLEGRPILLTEPDYCPVATQEGFDWLMRYEDDFAVLIIGGENAVGDAVLGDLWVNVANPDTLYYFRVSGSNRYDTAAKCVQDYWGLDVDIYGLASGTTFPDALSAGPVVGRLFGALLLTPPDRLASESRAQLASDKEYIWDVIVAGGTSAVSSSVSDAVAATLGTAHYDMNHYSGVTVTSVSTGASAAEETAGSVATSKADDVQPEPRWTETGLTEFEAYTGPASR